MASVGYPTLNVVSNGEIVSLILGGALIILGIITFFKGISNIQKKQKAYRDSLDDKQYRKYIEHIKSL